MPQPICPYLGLKRDPSTVLEFPSERNYCHHARPIAPVNLRHQRLACLTDRYVNCPVYQQAREQSLPEDLLLPSFNQIRQRWIILAVFAFLIIGGLIAGGISATRINGDNAVPQTGGTNKVGEGSQDLLLITEALSLTNDALSSRSNLTPVQGTPTECVPPEGWIAYLVKPTDSLLRLSLLYRTSVEVLQSANCLEERTLIRPGEILYVPPSPTPTITFTRTPTRTRVPVLLNNPTSPSHGENPPPFAPTSTFTVVPSNTSRPTATSIPPTATSTPLPTLPPPPPSPTLPLPTLPPTAPPPEPTPSPAETSSP